MRTGMPLSREGLLSLKLNSEALGTTQMLAWQHRAPATTRAGSQALLHPVVQPCNTSGQPCSLPPAGTALCPQPSRLCSQEPACCHAGNRCEWRKGSKLCLLPSEQPAPEAPEAAPKQCVLLQTLGGQPGSWVNGKMPLHEALDIVQGVPMLAGPIRSVQHAAGCHQACRT